MTDTEFTALSASILASIRKGTPWDTGNLAKNATKIRSIGAGNFEICIDEKIAPYFRYVNGQAYIGGRENRNFGYFDRAVKKALVEAANAYGGILVND